MVLGGKKTDMCKDRNAYSSEKGPRGGSASNMLYILSCALLIAHCQLQNSSKGVEKALENGIWELCFYIRPF